MATFAYDPNALRAMPSFTARTYLSLEFVGYVLPAYVLGCAVKKHALRFIEDGDVQAVANIDVAAESLFWCLDCSRRKPNDPDADSHGVRDCQEKLSMENEVNKKSDQLMLAKSLGGL